MLFRSSWVLKKFYLISSISHRDFSDFPSSCFLNKSFEISLYLWTERIIFYSCFQSILQYLKSFSFELLLVAKKFNLLNLPLLYFQHPLLVLFEQLSYPFLFLFLAFEILLHLLSCLLSLIRFVLKSQLLDFLLSDPLLFLAGIVFLLLLPSLVQIRKLGVR